MNPTAENEASELTRRVFVITMASCAAFIAAVILYVLM